MLLKWFIIYNTNNIASDNKCTVDIISFIQIAPSTFKLHLAVAPNQNERPHEWSLEKQPKLEFMKSHLCFVIDQNENINKERFKKIVLTAINNQNAFYYKINDAISLKIL
jgi:16S rRNA (uracil1498-N3)-methyltransferase